MRFKETKLLFQPLTLVFSKSSADLVILPILIKLFESLSPATSYSLSARQPLFVIIRRMVCGV